MEQITSELKFTDVSVKVPNYNQLAYKDNHVTMYENGYTQYLRATPTRYVPAFYYYTTDSIIGISLAYYGEYTEQELNLLKTLDVDSALELYNNIKSQAVDHPKFSVIEEVYVARFNNKE